MSTTRSTTTATANAAVPATPAVLALADRLGVTLATVVGTGVGGRIRVDDVRAAAPHGWFPGTSAARHSTATTTQTSSAHNARPDVDGWFLGVSTPAPPDAG